MKLNKTTLLFIATLLFLAVPLVFLTSNASAVTATAGTYNTDAAVQNTTGGWSVPSNFYCIGAPSAWDGSGAIQNATLRSDLNCSDTTNPVCSTCAITGAVANAVKYSDYPTNTVKRGIDDCVAHGYAWSGYSQSCGAATWTTNDPDNSPLPYYTDHKGCLRCHNDAYINAPGGRHAGDNWAVKESYLKGGHKNMVRKVSAGAAWGLPGTDASGIYSTDSSGNAINWLNGTINISGTDYTLYWIYGGNGLEGTTPRAIASNGGSYSCGRCHATGWTSDASINTAKEPEASFPGILSQIPAINTKGGISGDSNLYSSWDRWGIQCSRCHEAKGGPAEAEAGIYSGGHTTFPENTSTGGDVTALCMNCHRQESSGVPDVISGYKVAANSPASTLVIGGSHGLPPVGFVSHSHGTQFLNSPHARMTGTWSQIGCPPVSISPAGTAGCDSSMSTYNTDFAAAAVADGLSAADGTYTGQYSVAGGCTTCHDVHNTVLENVDGQSNGSTTECTACHSNTSDTLTPQVNLANIKHPSGTGTPLNDANPCAVCHMPGGQHIFRISTDSSYTEFPAAALAADMPAPTAKDADGFDAVWVDLDQACGQCHGGGTSKSANPPQAGIMWFSKASLATYAAGMHSASALPPAVSHTGGDAVLKGTATTIVDTSTDSNGETPDTLSIFLNWGDGSTSTGNGGATFTHTYALAGTFNIVHSATDIGGRTASEAVFQVKVATQSVTKTQVKVTVKDSSGNPVTGARLYLKKDGLLNTTGYSNASGQWTFKKLNPASSYTVAAYKSGLNFGNGKGKVGTDTPIVVTVDDLSGLQVIQAIP